MNVYINWLVLAIYATIVVGAMVAILMDNRQPAKTMAWMLVLTFMPFVGIILYFFFGKNTRKEKLISQRSLDRLTKRSMTEFIEQHDLQVPESHQVLARLFTEQNWAFPFKDNEVDIFTDGYDFVSALLVEISKASQHIHLESYIIGDDPLGRLVADA